MTAAEASASARSVATEESAGREAVNGKDMWSRQDTLDDHFTRHGQDFGMTADAAEHAQKAQDFRLEAMDNGYQAKVDKDGVVRIYDPETNRFGAYNADGTTKTFFGPKPADYFERQPGTSVDLRTEKVFTDQDPSGPSANTTGDSENSPADSASSPSESGEDDDDGE